LCFSRDQKSVKRLKECPKSTTASNPIVVFFELEATSPDT
jgi:hypothetical protein